MSQQETPENGNGGATPEAPQTPPTAPAQQAPETGAANVSAIMAELEKTKAALKAANAESADRRHKLSEVESRLAELDAAEQKRREAEMSEMEKLQAQLDKANQLAQESQKAAEQARAEARQRMIESAIVAQAADKFVDARDVVMVLADKIEIDDKGQPVGIDEALAKLAEQKPHWIKQGQRQITKVLPTNPGPAATENGRTEEQLARQIYGETNRNILSAEYARKYGGGVIFNKPPEIQ